MPDTVAFSVADVTVAETAGSVTLELIRTGDLVGPIDVTYDVTGASATAGEDFEGGGGTLTIPTGAAGAVIEVDIVDDGVPEDGDPDAPGVQPETFGVSLTDAVGGEVGLPRTANVFIVEDGSPEPPPSPTDPVYTAREEVVVPEVEDPIALEWLPGDPEILVIAEKGGAVRVYDTAADAFLPDLVDLSDEVNSAADRGLIDLVLDPDFPDNPKVYMTYTVDPPGVADNTGNAGPDGAGNRFNWLVSFDVDLSGDSPVVDPTSKQILLGAAGQSLDEIAGAGELDYTDPAFGDVATYPASEIDPATGDFRQDYWKNDSRSHVGGGLTFGPDGELYVAVGDGTSFNYADERTLTVQDVDSLAGKILRIDPASGAGLPTNPFYTGDPTDNASKVFQLGLRNPLRIDLDDDGELFISNTGWFSWEEINSGGTAANFGWPLFEGGDGGELLRTPGYRDLAAAAPFYDAFEDGELAVTPPYRAFSHTAGVTDVEIDGLVGATTVYEGDVYPADIQGDFFFVDINVADAVYSVDTDDPDSVRKLFELPDLRGPIVMKEGPDGLMYFGDLRQDFVGRWVLDDAVADDRLEAEAATLAGTVGVESVNPGFSGTGYADFGTAADDAVEWTVEVPASGAYDLDFRYANGGGGEDRSLLLEVDGVTVERLAFAPTGAWFSWADQTTSAALDLDAGTRTIRLQSDGGDGPNVDYLALAAGSSPPPPPPGDDLEAETATLGGTVVVAAANPGFSGAGYADFGISADDFVEWTVEVDEAGAYDLAFAYANGGAGEDRSLLLTVNGVTVERLAFDATGAWTAWAVEPTTDPVDLAAGLNTVRLQSDGGPGPNLDVLELALNTAPPPPPPPATGLEAEDADFGGTVTPAAANAGFTGTGYLDFGTSAADFVEWTVEVDEAGVFEPAFGYANGGGGEDRSLLLEVDGTTVERLPFATTGTWTDWGTQVAAPIALAAGTHTLRLQSDGGDGPNLDALDLRAGATPPPPEPDADLEAENAELGGSVVVAATNPGFRGTGYVDFGTSADDAVEWTVEIAEGGTYDLAFGYANGGAGEDRSLLLEVDDTFVERLGFATTGGWTDWAEQDAGTTLDLAAGTHTIRLASDGGDGPNLDYVALEFADAPA
jgi:glucose/arabinose dehydrogenase